MQISKRVEFDAGHRVPSHKSKCRNIHGHRYVLEATVEGMIKPVRGESDDGMVIDFGDLKHAMMERVHDVLDHAFIVYKGDHQCKAALLAMDADHKTVTVPFIPTAENLVEWIFWQIVPALPPEMKLVKCRLYETPSSWADFS